ncbi:hypothetical protein [Candidatus Methylobacter favarea]|uniref:hypothetical protein n=1 Tax=Candidatus Methylobacter favarea TaxID=2707345 RepID=UPI00157DC982|nr:hypothetical protein [Candidatus Methylobacter favarea]
MIIAAFNLGIVTLLFFIIGMIKPKWVLFFLKKPDRFMVLIISAVLFMISATLYGEGNRREEMKAASKKTAPQNTSPMPSPIPVPKTSEAK